MGNNCLRTYNTYSISHYTKCCMGTEFCLLDPLTGPVKVMLNKLVRDILEQVPLWHKVLGVPIKGTLSEALLAECRNKLQDFEKTKKGKASRIDWEDFRKVGELERRADKKM